MKFTSSGTAGLAQQLNEKKAQREVCTQLKILKEVKCMVCARNEYQFNVLYAIVNSNKRGHSKRYALK